MSDLLDFPLAKCNADSQQLVRVLGQQIRDLETGTRRGGLVVPSGCQAIDRSLPGGGFAAGSLVEFTTPSGLALGATSLALCVARQAIASGKYLVLIDTQSDFYPPALERLGLPLERVIGLRPANHSDLIWAMDQALRCSAVGCVVANIDRLDDRTARRFQLAIETGGGLGILIRPAATVRYEPSWADVQWQVNSLVLNPHRIGVSQDSAVGLHRSDISTRWFQMTLKRCQGGKAGTKIRVGLNACGEWVSANWQESRHAEASHVHLAAELAKPARVRREAAG